ncbi:hypothetical protein OROGR_029741 [Orobanche gracilis]
MDSDAKMVFDSVFPFGDGLLAFEHEGKVVRRAYRPIIEEDAGFPFYHGDLQKEALSDLRGVYSWGSDDDIYVVFEKDSDAKRVLYSVFPSGIGLRAFGGTGTFL